MREYRIVECPCCEGDGFKLKTIWVYEHGCGFGHEDVFKTNEHCSYCEGSGTELIPVYPVTLDDLNEQDAEGALQ